VQAHVYIFLKEKWRMEKLLLTKVTPFDHFITVFGDIWKWLLS
jgi:hypothetical protein